MSSAAANPLPEGERWPDAGATSSSRKGELHEPVSAVAEPGGPGSPNVIPFATSEAAASPSSHASPQPNIQVVDFRQPALLTAAEQRKLRLRHDEFTRALATRLSIYLRLDFSMVIPEFQTLAHSHFAESLASPTHLVFFRAEGLPQTAILQIPPCFGLAVVERLLGGKGQPSEPRELTDIEVAVLHQFVLIVLKEWCRSIAHLPEEAAQITGHETNPAFVQTAPKQTNVLVLKLDTRMGEHTAPMQLAVPYPMLDPIVRQFNVAPPSPELTVPPSIVQWNPAFDMVPVNVTAEWHGLEVPARRLAELSVGDLLPAGDPAAIQVLLAGVLRFGGRLGASNNKRAVELLKAASPRMDAL